MIHLTQQDIDPKLRRPHVKRYKVELAVALQNPGLPDAQRDFLQERLANVGKPRVYRANSPAPPGAVDPGPLPKDLLPLPHFDSAPSREVLSELRTSTLLRYAEANNLDVTTASTKAQVIQAILAPQGDKT